MSAIYRGRSDIHVITDYPALSYPAWQLSQEISISKVVDGFPLVMSCSISPSQVTSITWKGVEFVTAPDNGRGVGFNLYIGNGLNQEWAGTEPGNSDDSPPLGGTSNPLARGLKSAAAEGMIRVEKSAFWQRAGQKLGSVMALNIRDLCEAIATIDNQIGLAGNDHIITFDTSVVVPVDPIIQAAPQLSFMPLYHYSPNADSAPSFDSREWVNFLTGATRAYTSGQTSTTEVVMLFKADGSAANAAIYGSGVMGTGVYKSFSGPGALGFEAAFGFPVVSYVGGVPPGIARLPAALCVGTRADLIGPSGAIVTAYANLPAASYPS
jgi:hypothetical protein